MGKKRKLQQRRVGDLGKQVVLEGDFYARVQDQEGWINLALTHQEILISGEEKGCLARRIRFSLNFSDLVAVRPAALDKKTRGRCPVFMLVFYPRKKNIRKKFRVLLYLQHGIRREEAIKTSNIWVATISRFCIGIDPEYSMAHQSKPLLVIICPISGKGRSRYLWEQTRGILQEGGVHWEVISTQGPGHARDIAAKLDLDEWRGMLIVSGDGVVHEVYNGLFIRSDWRRALEFPLSVLPAGSGNALCWSTLLAQGDVPEKETEEYGAMTQALAVARGNVAPLDLLIVRTSNETKIGFLSLGWGLLSDVDIGSEHLRNFGDARFVIHGVIKIMKRQVYRGTVSYVPVDLPSRRTIQVPIHGETDSDWTESSQEFSVPVRSGQRTGSGRRPTHFDVVPYLPSSKGPTHSVSLYGGLPAYHDGFTNNFLHYGGYPVHSIYQSPYSIYSTLPPNLSQTYALSWEELDQRLCTVSFIDLEESQEEKRQPSSRNGGKSVASSNPLQSLPVSPTPTGDPPTAPSPVFPRKASQSMDPYRNPYTATPLYQDWVTENSEYLCIYLLNLPFVDRTSRLAPQSTIDDGVMWLLLIRKNCTRATLFRAVSMLEYGNHINLPGIDMFPVSAVKIQPSEPGRSYMALDGERIEAGDIQVQSMPGAARVFVK